MFRLDVGLQRSAWAMCFGCALPSVAVLNLLLLLIGWTFASSEIPGLSLVVLLPLLMADVLLVVILVHHYRNAFWLGGRTLARRTVTGRKYYDLSMAHVGVENARPAWAGWATQTLPRLVVGVPGRAPVKLWLRDPNRRGALLPPAQLAALAQAIDPGLRHPVARRLWELASDPLRGVL